MSSWVIATEEQRRLEAIEAQFRLASGRRSQIVETPGFLVHLLTKSDPFYRNVAVPIERLGDWAPAILAMRQAFERGRQRPKLEFIEERWPDLGQALEAAGFVCEGRFRAMVAVPGAAVPAGEVRLGSLVPLTGGTRKAVLRQYLEGLQLAFDSDRPPTVSESDVDRLQQALRHGRTLIGVVQDQGGWVVAGANLIGIDRIEGVTGQVAELSGVWTTDPLRGLGLARAVAADLLARFFAAHGGLVWLAAEDVRAQRLYAEIGFRPIGHQLHYTWRAT